jgi:hypothetical protein
VSPVDPTPKSTRSPLNHPTLLPSSNRIPLYMRTELELQRKEAKIKTIKEQAE